MHQIFIFFFPLSITVIAKYLGGGGNERGRREIEALKESAFVETWDFSFNLSISQIFIFSSGQKHHIFSC